MSTDILTIENVSLNYGRQKALDSVSMAVKAGETFGLIGANGAGKTSLLKIILGLRPQDSGSVHVFGQPSASASGRKRLCHLPERFDPPWFLSGQEFLDFSLSLYGKTCDKAMIEKAVHTIELDPAALKRRVQTYSKGMRQKLGLLATFLTGCDLLLLDEPMSGLDPIARRKVKDMILLGKTAGQTVFMNSHILSDMDEICDHVAILHKGLIVAAGRPEDIKKSVNANNLESAFLHIIEEKRAA
jgi:ABC-2 type transport system ATP-binding protein